MYQKFGIALDPKPWVGLPRAKVASLLKETTRAVYTRREAEFPVRVAMTKFIADRTPGQTPRYDREGIANWVSERFATTVTVDEIANKLRPEILAHLNSVAIEKYRGAEFEAETADRIEAAFGPAPAAGKPEPTPDSAALADLSAWARREFGAETTPDFLARGTRDEARNLILRALDARYRPEMRELEKSLVLQFLDSAWMEHLRSMDHLRSSVGLRGYAQVDPKVEYKREGMKIFEQMWSGVSDKVTDLIFRMEDFDPDFLAYLGSRWQLDKAKTIHESPAPEPAAAGAGGVRAQQEAAIAASKGERKAEPLRNQGRKVGRNDPCPCGSGKKFKACCMRKEQSGDFS
jgi:preprotein translocase subunit SecA